MQGEDVQILHSELQSLSYEIPREEIERHFFGPATHDAVLDFQRKRGLEPNGVVDEDTAHAINSAVEAQRPIPEQFIVSGQVRHQDETPLKGLIVRAFDLEPDGEAQLGEEVFTDGRGGYEITYLAEALSQREKRRADLLEITKPSISLLSPNSNPRLKKS
jgi:peptidoglycan hydrolase-like protein with peptidoglycan-binding domain